MEHLTTYTNAQGKDQLQALAERYALEYEMGCIGYVEHFDGSLEVWATPRIVQHEHFRDQLITSAELWRVK